MSRTKDARLSLTLPGRLDGEAQKAPRTSHDGVNIPGAAADSHGGHDLTGPSSISTTPPKQQANVEIPPEPQSPAITSLPPLPQSPKHSRENSKTLFANIRAAKSSAKIPTPDLTLRTAGNDLDIERIPRPPYGTQRAAPGPPPSQDDSASVGGDTLVDSLNETYETSHEARVTTSFDPITNVSVAPSDGFRATSATPTSGFRDDEAPPQPGRPAPVPGYNSKSLPRNLPSTPQTPNSKKSGNMFGFMKKPTTQQQSGEHREYHTASDAGLQSQERSVGGHERMAINPLAANDPKHVLTTSKSGFLKALKTGTNKAMSGYKKGKDKILKGSQKTTTGQMPPQRGQVPDPDYEMQIIGRPLLDQVRLTRIAPRLEQSRDKTEFWLPALPWRCIDYLNLKGVEEEGIYRHSGSQLQINYYKQKFDRERDFDLYDEAELYDVNTVSSLLKAWFRDLPDELFPNSMQEALVAKYAGSPGAPDALKRMISQLEPWRYYLLFAITCHLSLISSCSDRNRMTIDNLHTCIGRSLRIERVVFFWLVGDWRNCWAGCDKEKEYLDAEYAWLADETAQLEGDSSNPPSRQQELSGFALPPSLQPARVPSPSSQISYRANSPDSRLGSSSSRTNMQQEITYHTSSSQVNLTVSSSRNTGSRKANDNGHSNPRSFADRMQQQTSVEPTATRERSPVGRRPARTDGSLSRADERAQGHRRAQSQPRSDSSQQRGKSPNSSSGRRRPRGDTVHGNTGSPANRSPSQGSDPYFESSNSGTKGVSGRRRKEGHDAPEMPIMTKERLESLQREGGYRSRKGSETGDSRSRDRRERDLPPQLDALKLDMGTSGDFADLTPSQDKPPVQQLTQQPPQQPPPPLPVQEGSKRGHHERKDSKFRLSQPKFPAPLSPTFRGT